MNRKFIVFLFTLLVVTGANAGVKVTSLDLRTSATNGHISISTEGRSRELPDMVVNGKTIEITLTDADAFNDIIKNIRGTELSAKNLNGKAVVKINLPYSVNPETVNLGWKNKNIEVVFPRVKTAVKALPVVQAKAENQVAKEALNEDYLNSLMTNDKVVRRDSDAPAPTKPEGKKIEKVNQAVSVKAAALSRDKKESFSFAGYAAKFTVFLALVLGLFYGVVQLLKKGVFRRGKLGFLNNSKMIEVLSTTYVSPKRSLMIVKAHKQIFLVANSENGLEFLSEMKDTAGLIKEGEKFITGSNFDTNLGVAEDVQDNSEIKLKEDITTSTPVGEKSLSKATKDIVKFSDELKKKAKKLKPIEFN